MQQLTGLDALFLELESPEMPMHVGSLNIYELPAGFRGSYVAHLRKHLQARLPILPVLRKRLWRMPLNLANPAWVDAEPDLAYHVLGHRLPVHSGREALETLVGQLHTQLLDRARPLFRFHVIEGLVRGQQGQRLIAVYTQLHHAAVDGQAAVALAQALLDVTPKPRAIESRPSRRPRRTRLGVTEMLRGAIAQELQQVAGIVRGLPEALGAIARTAAQALSAESRQRYKQVRNIALAPRTPFNTQIGQARAFATATLPLNELKAIGKAHGATLNDMVLMVCSTALRRYLATRRQLPKKPLIAEVPISLRDAGDERGGTQASMGLASLGTHLADPRRRLAHIKTSTAAMKATMGPLRRLMPTDYPSIGMPWLVEALGALYSRSHLADRIPMPANLVISNVPGSPVPLYLAGARMLTNYPTSIVVHGIALNITVESYERSLDFGIMADARAVPDVRDLAQGLHEAMDELRAM
ncbi:MAG: wax ester/triacylglycerol synthase family O-acyltransferase [Rubrivivax sp.]|nr:wax ester/triacylglycerol synthase family O-acyltransferase [Rubrivivax sp.]